MLIALVGTELFLSLNLRVSVCGMGQVMKMTADAAGLDVETVQRRWEAQNMMRMFGSAHDVCPSRTSATRCPDPLNT